MHATSRATFVLVGQDVEAHGVFLNHYLSKKPLPESTTTLAEAFLAQGYQTGACISTYTLDREIGLNVDMKY